METNIKLKSKDITGFTSGMITAVKPTNKRSTLKCIVWECTCECGGKIDVCSNKLRNYEVSHCGCLNDYVKRMENAMNGMLCRNNPNDVFYDCVSITDAKRVVKNYLEAEMIMHPTSDNFNLSNTDEILYMGKFFQPPPSTLLTKCEICGRFASSLKVHWRHDIYKWEESVGLQELCHSCYVKILKLLYEERILNQLEFSIKQTNRVRLNVCKERREQ